MCFGGYKVGKKKIQLEIKFFRHPGALYRCNAMKKGYLFHNHPGKNTI
jgi:hypothetical protein